MGLECMTRPVERQPACHIREKEKGISKESRVTKIGSISKKTVEHREKQKKRRGQRNSGEEIVK